VVSGQRPSPEPGRGSALNLQAWLRPLQQALQLEADRGFGNLQGRREPFQAFLSRELRQAPIPLAPHQASLLSQLAEHYDRYLDLTEAQRQNLVRRTRQGLHELQRALEPERPAAPPRLRLLPDPAAVCAAPRPGAGAGAGPGAKLHVLGALNNGVTVEEIRETLIHATAYCGIPAGLESFKTAHEVLIAQGAIPAPTQP